MSWSSPKFVKRKDINATDLRYAIVPNPISIIEPVVADGEIVFAEDPLDIVSAGAFDISFAVVKES